MKLEKLIYANIIVNLKELVCKIKFCDKIYEHK
jgi:hypothetical protein